MSLLSRVGLLFPLFACSFLQAASAPAPAPEKFRDATPLEWSVRIARSEMARQGERMFADANPKAKWSYTTPLFGLSLMRLGDHLGDASYTTYGARTATSFLAADGSIPAYKKSEYNIDLVAPGKVLVRLWETGSAADRTPALRAAIENLRDQMRTHPRTKEGGFWHKQRYPHQMWLDGLFMASPFLAHYAKTFDEPALFDEVAKQIVLMDKHAYDPATGLHFHAWDEARAQPWADKETGDSPGFWSRAIGWYAMAIVDTLEYLPADHPDAPKIREILGRVADGIARWQDPATGLWWQVTDQGAREANYLEGTASSMFVYSLAKAINQGALPADKYLFTLRKGYAGLVRDLIRVDADDSVSLTRCCEVAGLGGKGQKGQPRDGSFAYYVSEPIIDNDHKGVGPFISAGVELDRLLRSPAATASYSGFVARSWADYPAMLARIKAPTFPNRDFPITDFGAKPGVDNTDAIHAAIAACNQAGGGRVLVPAGEWLTGAIRLKSKVNLHLVEGATLLWSFDLARYPVVFTRWEGMECMNYSPFIYAYGEKDIAITGKGTLDGGSTLDTWWGWSRKDGPTPRIQKPDRDKLNEQNNAGVPVAERVYGPGHYLRPNFIQPYLCENILVEGVKIVRSPMWEVNPVLCRNVTVRGLTIVTHGPNNDGCDPESSIDVLIEDTLFDTGDDCIAIKSGRNNDGRRVGVPSENLVVRDCVMKEGHGGVVLGSECSGHIRNVFVENCTMDSPELDRALRFKNNAVRGGILENVFMRDVKIGQVAEAVVTIDLLYEEGANGFFPPVVRNVQLDRVEAAAAPRLFYIRGFAGAVVEDIRVNDSVIKGLTQPEVMQHAGAISLRNVQLEPANLKRPKNSVPPPPSTPAASAPAAAPQP